jgi:hypothetical protein
VKKYRIDLLNYFSVTQMRELFINDLRKAFQISKDWHFGSIGEEDETIKYYKKRLRVSSVIGYILLALILVLFILIISI